jgi:hypothetical protein
MIDNEFIFEIDKKFDTEYLLKLVTRATSRILQKNELQEHQRLVEDDPYLKSIKIQYPILSPKWNFYRVEPYNNIPTHIDALRNCALNIPLCGTEGSKTIFYKSTGLENFEYDDKKLLHWTKHDVEKVYEFSLTNPTLIKNNVQHGVVNGPHRRIILSWSVDLALTFEQAKEIFKST